MTRLFTNRPVAISIAIAAILLSSFIVFWLVRGSQSLTESNISREQYRNASNISREQYDTALAKWNNLHVTDYEATVQHSNWGKWKIVVHVDGSYGNAFDPSAQASYSHRIVRLESLDSESAKLAKLDYPLYQFMTVGGLFEDVDGDLYCQENSCEHRDFFDPSRYVIEFDQTMGYPLSIKSINAYAIVETRIENVKILK